MKKWISWLLTFCLLINGMVALAEELKEDKGGFLGSVSSALENGWGDVSQFAQDAAGFISDKAGEAWEEASGAATEAWGYVSDVTGEAWENVSQFADEQLEKLSSSASETWTKVSEAAGDAWDGATEAVSGVWNNVTGAFEPSITDVTSEDQSSVSSAIIAPDEQMFYFGTIVNTGKDNGFTGSNEITIKDPHYGWKLGSFYINGFTRAMSREDGYPVFLKTVGDKVALHFELYQDINHLNGQQKLTIAEDINGYDQYFGIPKTNFGRGALIIKHINFQNRENMPTIYTDFFPACISEGAETTVELLEEGDYEVALDYEINNPGALNIASYTDYRLFFKFSVRNGNCMVFPFDVATGAELTDTAITENGFRLDLARSRYLDINVKKETLTSGSGGLVEDTRFNRPAKDGDEYTDEGIYTITVSNRYTGVTTTKKIFVGSREALQNYRDKGVEIGD